MAKTIKNNEYNESAGIPEMNLGEKYSENKKNTAESPEKMQKALEKTKKELEKLKIFIVKKYPFTEAIGILPPQAVSLFLEEELEENIAKEEAEKIQKKVHLYIIIPEDKFKDMSKIKKEIVSEIEKSKQNVWIHIKTPVDVWESCLDSKFELVNAIGMSFPLHDKGILSALRVAEIHKSLVLQKFDKYVVSYVVGGSLIRGNVTKTSDVDSFVIINDTDVKRMPRLELKERLRGMIYQYIAEATALAGVKKDILNVQIYLLTDFWESVKDAHPVMFTFIRDGVPLYDKGTFLPWKALLKMGRLKPSPEAIDMFMKTAEKTGEFVERRLIDAMIDLYYKVLNPSQALIMLYGSPPPTHKETPKLMKDIFVTKEKILKVSEVSVLEKLVEMFRQYEHNPKMKVTGSEIDVLTKSSDVYIKRLEELRKDIEKRSQEKIIEQIYQEIFELLGAIIGKKSQVASVAEFDKLVKKGKFTQQHSKILKDIIKAKSEFKKTNMNIHRVDEIRKNAAILINELLDYSQRCDLVALEKGRMRLRYKKNGKDALAELLHCNGESFLFVDGNIKKITEKVENSNMKEVSNAIEQQKARKELEISSKIFELLKKELGEFEIVL
ncbi:hypothetical protein FJZ20_01255 [Candidatus Pacearchaeota archaeon]|nr:hypothetical protein [Candidatus Pacearchaeota archaeon]